MRQILSDCWTLDLPEEWQAEIDDDTVIVTDDDNLSTIELSAMRKAEGEVSGEDLAEFAEELNARKLPRKDTALGDFSGFCYTCLEDDKSLDDAAVDFILDTLNYLPGDAPELKDSSA